MQKAHEAKKRLVSKKTHLQRMAADPTVEILAALNKALAEGRVTPEEYGKRAKMISAAKAQREEDRRTEVFFFFLLLSF